MKGTHLFNIICPHQKGGIILREVCGTTFGNKAVLIPFAMFYQDKDARSKYLRLLIIHHSLSEYESIY